MHVFDGKNWISIFCFPFFPVLPWESLCFSGLVLLWDPRGARLWRRERYRGQQGHSAQAGQGSLGGAEPEGPDVPLQLGQQEDRFQQNVVWGRQSFIFNKQGNLAASRGIAERLGLGCLSTTATTKTRQWQWRRHGDSCRSASWCVQPKSLSLVFCVVFAIAGLFANTQLYLWLISTCTVCFKSRRHQRSCAQDVHEMNAMFPLTLKVTVIPAWFETANFESLQSSNKSPKMFSIFMHNARFAKTARQLKWNFANLANDLCISEQRRDVNEGDKSSIAGVPDRWQAGSGENPGLPDWRIQMGNRWFSLLLEQKTSHHKASCHWQVTTVNFNHVYFSMMPS